MRLVLFSALRRASLRLAVRARPGDLKRTANHREREMMPLAALIVHWAGHDLLHLRQIERIQAVVTGGRDG